MLGIQADNADGGRVNTGSGQRQGGFAKQLPERLLCVVFGSLPTQKRS